MYYDNAMEKFIDAVLKIKNIECPATYYSVALASIKWILIKSTARLNLLHIMILSLKYGSCDTYGFFRIAYPTATKYNTWRNVCCNFPSSL